MKADILFITPEGRKYSGEFELHPDINILIGDKVNPIGGWLLPDEVIPDPDENICDGFFDWICTSRTWSYSEYNDNECLLILELTGKSVV